jgi:pSer/pThr/pTyr-binding forkhead associated (FHA) protein
MFYGNARLTVKRLPPNDRRAVWDVSAFWLKYRGTRFPLRRGETVIGRSPYCSIVLSNTRASRQHCAITWNERGLALNDLGSSNGTYLNGTLLKRGAMLRAGDVVTVGTDVLEVIEVHRKATAGVTRTEQGPLPEVAIEEFDGGQSTKRQDMTLDVIEAIAENVAEEGLSSRAAVAVMRAVDVFLTSLGQTHRRLEPIEASRLAAVMELVGARESSADFAAWKHRTIERISRDAIAEEST